MNGVMEGYDYIERLVLRNGLIEYLRGDFIWLGKKYFGVYHEGGSTEEPSNVVHPGSHGELSNGWRAECPFEQDLQGWADIAERVYVVEGWPGERVGQRLGESLVQDGKWNQDALRLSC